MTARRSPEDAGHRSQDRVQPSPADAVSNRLKKPDPHAVAGREASSSQQWQRIVEWALLAVGAMVYVTLPHLIDGDAAVRYDSLVKLVDRHQLSNARYSIVQEVVSIPLYVLGNRYRAAFAFVERFNLLVFFGGVVALYWMFRRHLNRDVLRRFLLLLVAGTMFPYHTRITMARSSPRWLRPSALHCTRAGSSLPGRLLSCSESSTVPPRWGALYRLLRPMHGGPSAG